MTSEYQPTISSHARLCLQAFERLSSTVESDEDAGPTDSQLSVQMVKDEKGRFRVWAGNIGALQTAMASLDWRLREASHIRQPCLKLLKDLHFSLRELHSILSGERLPRDAEPSSSDSLSDSGSEVFFSEGSSADESDSVAEEVVELPKTEEQYLWQSVIESVSSLFKLSMVIRSATPRDRYAKAANIPRYIDTYDIAHVCAKFPRMLETQWLAEKLGKANAKRRQYLKYREKHREKLARDVDEAENPNGDAPFLALPKAPGQTLLQSVVQQFDETASTRFAPTLAPTTASTFIIPSLPEIETVDETSDAGQSQTSYATSVGEEAAEELRVPPLPIDAQDERPFECPYCYTIQTVKGSHSWKKHVFTDLEPYICTFKDCHVKPFSTRRSWFHHEMEMHRKEWLCHSCNITFASPDVMRNHLKRKHGTLFTETQLPAILERCERPRPLTPDCPFCETWATSLRERMAHLDPMSVDHTIVVTPKQFQTHVGRHLEQLSLFALPRSFGDDEDDHSFGSNKAEDHKGSDEDSSVQSVQDDSIMELNASQDDSQSLDIMNEEKRSRTIHSAALSGDLEAVLRFLEDGLSVDTKDANGNTPLALASSKGHEKVALLLLERGASLDISDINGFKPVDLARIGRHEALEHLLSAAEKDGEDGIFDMPEILSTLDDVEQQFNPERDASLLHGLLEEKNALNRADQQSFIEILPRLTFDRIAALDEEFQKLSRRNYTLARQVLNKLPSGSLREIAWSCVAGPHKAEARWVSGFFLHGEKNMNFLIEALLDKQNRDIQSIRESFECPKFNNDLQKAIIWDMKADSVRNCLLLAINIEQRMADDYESTEEDTIRDVERLFESLGDGSTGGGEKVLSEMLMRCNESHLRKISSLYHEIYGGDLLEIISSSFKGTLGTALRYTLQGALNRPLRDAALIYDALGGSSQNVKERLLTSRLVRVHWDPKHMDAVKKAYEEAFGVRLVGRLGMLLKGAYRDFIVEMCRHGG